MRSEMQSLNSSIAHVNAVTNETAEKLYKLEKENDKLKQNMIDIEARSMRENLIFTNIYESKNESAKETENKLREFFESKLKMDRKEADAIVIDRVHRMASDTKKTAARNIIAKISSTKDRKSIKRRTKALAGSNQAVFQQYPPEIVGQRKELFPMMKRREKGLHFLQ